MRLLLPSALIVATAVWFARRQLVNADQAAPVELQDFIPFADNFDGSEGITEPDQLPTFLETVAVNLNPYSYTPANVSDDQAARNERAFLDMIAYAEGTNGPNGYRTLFGGGLFDSMADHPRVYKPFTNGRGETLRSSAAGRYQFLVKTWDTLRGRLDLPDFGPASQDSAALELIRERGALNDVRAGRTSAAIAKIAPIWASMPGAGYAQPEKKITALLAQFRAAGGNLEA
jgi:muramidase (phage lysozyme)